MPELWIVAGPNGAGKTALTREKFAVAVDGFAWVNPDDTTLLVQNTYTDLTVEPDLQAANLLAAIADTQADEPSLPEGKSARTVDLDTFRKPGDR